MQCLRNSLTPFSLVQTKHDIVRSQYYPCPRYRLPARSSLEVPYVINLAGIALEVHNLFIALESLGRVSGRSQAQNWKYSDFMVQSKLPYRPVPHLHSRGQSPNRAVVMKGNGKEQV